MSGSAIASATLADVIEAARRGRGLLAPETAGYLVLAIADQLLSAPSVIDHRRCAVLVDGGRVVVSAAAPSTPLEAERALRRLLQDLLQVSHGGAPALRALASAAPKGDVESLIGELEAALIPVNRAAASRALARLARESVRARTAAARPEEPAASALPALPVAGSVPLGPPVRGRDFARRTAPPTSRQAESPAAPEAAMAGDPFAEEPVTKRRAALLDPLPATSGSDIDDLLRRAVASTPPSALQPSGRASSYPPATRSSRPASSRGVDELLADFAASPLHEEDLVGWDLRGISPRAAEPAGSTALSGPPDDDLRARAVDPPAAVPAPIAPASPPRAESRPSIPQPRARSGARWVLAILFLAAALAGAVFLLRRKPGFLSGRTPDVVEAERRTVAPAAASAAHQQAVGPCRASLVVTDVPPNAEVLVRSGVAPIDVDRVPSGARLEFVATSDGYAPRRGVVPQGAAWETAAGKRRYELAIQLERGKAKPGVLDPWPAAEPGSVVGGEGPPGTVHVVTSPRGAEVWMLAGGPPETTIEALPCGAGLELLVAGSQQGQPFRRRLRVDASQMTPAGSENVTKARVSASP